jgi:hypothetical protein
MPDLHKPADTTTYTGIAPILAGRGNLGLAPNKRYTSDTFVLVCNFAHHQRVWFGLNARQVAVFGEGSVAHQPVHALQQHSRVAPVPKAGSA